MNRNVLTTGRKRPSASVVCLSSLTMALSACGVAQKELSKNGSPLSEFSSAEAFAAIRVDAEALCLRGEAEVAFAEQDQQFGFAFAAEAGDALEAELQGDERLDTVLLLFGPDDGTGFFGRYPVALDDDGGTGTLSHLQGYSFKESGRFMLVATTYAGDGHGRANLSLSLGGAAGCFPERPQENGEVCCELLGPDGAERLLAVLAAQDCAERGGGAVEPAACNGQSADELCGDGRDNSGDGVIDEGCPATLNCCVLQEDDGSRYVAAIPSIDCEVRGGKLVDEILCGADGELEAEACGDGIDNNRDAQIDEGCPVEQLCCEIPADDGTRQYLGLLAVTCVERGGSVVDKDLCHAAGQLEICGDALDNNANQLVDEDCLPQQICCGFEDQNGSFQFFYGPWGEGCSAQGGLVVDPTRCATPDGETPPEVCGNAVDDDGDMAIDEGCGEAEVCCAFVNPEGERYFGSAYSEGECTENGGSVVEPAQCGAEWPEDTSVFSPCYLECRSRASAQLEDCLRSLEPDADTQPCWEMAYAGLDACVGQCGEGSIFVELCGDALDNDQDGEVDEGCDRIQVCCALADAANGDVSFIGLGDVECAVREGRPVEVALCDAPQEEVRRQVCCELVAAETGERFYLGLSNLECADRQGGEVDVSLCGGQPGGPVEQCGNELDDDLDGVIDEGCAPALACCLVRDAAGELTALLMSVEDCAQFGEIADDRRCE